MATGKYLRTPEIKEKNRISSTGAKVTEAQKQKTSKTMILWHKQHRHPRLGKKHTEATKRKMSEGRGGENHWNWQGGKTLIVRTFRKSKQYQQWRKAVFKRDKGICQKCGAKEDIISHHILAVKTHPQLRLDVDNGKTLCVDCHKETDNYGNRKVS